MARYWNFAVHEKSIMKTKLCPCCQDLILKILLSFDIRTSASPSSVFVQYKRAAVVTSNVSSKQSLETLLQIPEVCCRLLMYN